MAPLSLIRRGDRVALASMPAHVGEVVALRGYFAVVRFDPPLNTQVAGLVDLIPLPEGEAS